ncbi:amphiregulin isoform X2 [Tachyglossus aculeatus]|uniref:amphiregulin isoform X2 n=1 Tax=Tachyglossus aculeatus TaxID=9261 RepID=UPI0018F288FB|nr:amphiregulin isoform X2 [Tachyglossus aculeatus]
MRTPLCPPLLVLLLLCSDRTTEGPGGSSGGELSTATDKDYGSEEYENEPQISGYILDDSIRVEHLVKPRRNKTDSEKNPDRPKRKKNRGENGKNRKNKRKKTPCDADFKNYCIHGECKYIESVQKATCNCHQGYFGERCGEQSMKTHSRGDSDFSNMALAVVAVLVSVISFTAIVVIITIQIRKRYSNGFEGEAEERKKLRQDTGNGHVIV